MAQPGENVSKEGQQRLVKHPRASDDTLMHIIDQRDNLLYSCGSHLYDTTSSTVLFLTLVEPDKTSP